MNEFFVISGAKYIYLPLGTTLPKVIEKNAPAFIQNFGLGGCWLNPVGVGSRSQLITAKESGEALQAPPAGSGAEPQSPTNFVHFRLKSKHLVLYKSLFSENCLIIQE